MSLPPKPAYTPLTPPTELYNRIAATHGTPARRLITKFTIPPRSGKAWHVPATCVFRLTTPTGPQVGDLNIWNASDPRERFWAARTRQLQGSHVVLGDRLWSCLPFLRPLCGVVADTCGLGDRAVATKESNGFEDGRGERTQWGGRCHDLLGTRCDPYVNVLLTGTSAAHHCHSNLLRAVTQSPYCHPSLPLVESDIHDVLNVFQVTGLDAQGRYFMEASPATKNSYLEFFAEQDLVCALSTCPGGDLSNWGWGAGGEMASDCREIGVEVWELVGNNREEILDGWKAPERVKYEGGHGI